MREFAIILALLLSLPAMAQTPEDAASNRLFVEAVQLWNRAEGEPVADRAATLQRVQSNLRTIIERHPGSTLAVRLVIGETVGPLSVARAERATAEARARVAAAAGVDLVFRDCPECPEMVVIPAGGATRLAPGLDVTIAAPFAVGKFEVTFAEWDACVAQSGCSHLPDDRGWGRGRQPVMNVSWEDTQQYVEFLSRKTGRTYRLLSQVEWVYAAQAGSGREQVAEEGANQANCDGCGSRWDNEQTAPVGSFGANAFGLHDMLGNVWEWTADCMIGWSAADCSNRVLLGGSWDSYPRNTRSAYRTWNSTDYRAVSFGFRVARTL